jgi:hypothetical protein
MWAAGLTSMTTGAQLSASGHWSGGITPLRPGGSCHDYDGRWRSGQEIY